jgi:hypothetical protein
MRLLKSGDRQPRARRRRTRLYRIQLRAADHFFARAL